jgi:GDPmannose 4,6-dehydratase
MLESEHLTNVAIITGASGQDGSYLSEFLIKNAYEVHGITRSPAKAAANSAVSYHCINLSDFQALCNVIEEVKPTEIYNLAAQSDVQLSYSKPFETSQTNGLGALNLLEAIRTSKTSSRCRFCQAGTADMYGDVNTSPQDESTPFYPTSPYGIAKAFAHAMTVSYRKNHGLFSCNAILYNHESPRRSENFVTRKITKAAAAIAKGQQDRLSLGNLDALRDWSHAKDIVRGLWLSLQADHAEDYVFASGNSYSVREFATLAFEEVGIALKWEGTGLEERGICKSSGKMFVDVSPVFFRPLDGFPRRGNPTKAARILGWTAATTLRDIVSEMITAEMKPEY